MVLREEIEQREYTDLSAFAAKAAESRGRTYDEEKCSYRTDFQRDRDRIIHSKSFRRLMHKTQVFLSPEGDHFRTRLTHTLEVGQIARTISRALGLNEDLTEAIAMGHDLGHTPFGHNGEEYLNLKHPGGFEHNVQSLWVVEHVEKAGPALRGMGEGMNLTAEVRDGIVNHTGPVQPFTLEGQIVRRSDQIAYINHDIDDAIRAGVITEADLPGDCVDVLGHSHSQRITTLVDDIVTMSDGKDHICMSPEREQAMKELRSYMFEHVYRNPEVKKNADLEKIRTIIFSLYDYYLQHPDELPEERRQTVERWGIHTAIKDYIAGMTDRYAVNTYTDLFIPKGWK